MKPRILRKRKDVGEEEIVSLPLPECQAKEGKGRMWKKKGLCLFPSRIVKVEEGCRERRGYFSSPSGLSGIREDIKEIGIVSLPLLECQR